MTESRNLILNEVLELFCEPGDDYTYPRTLAQIILSMPPVRQDLNYRKKVTLETSFQYTESFLRSIKKEYAYHLKSKRDKIDAEKKDNQDIFSCPMSYIDDTGEARIYLPYQENIETTFILTHEIFHDMNLDPQNWSMTREVFSESISLLGEFLQDDFFKTQTSPPPDFHISKQKTLLSIQGLAASLKIVCELAFFYQKYHYVDNQILDIIYAHATEIECAALEELYTEIDITGELPYNANQEYVIGVLIASYMHERILKQPKNIEELLYMNENINKLSFEEVCYFLGLQPSQERPYEWNKETLKVLQKSLRKEWASR